MKRTPIKRKTPLKASAELKRKTALSTTGWRVSKRTPIKQQSAKKKAENNTRRELLRALVDERGEMCQAKVDNVCTGVAVDAHEVLTRARGGSAVDPENILLVCRACHEWIGAHPKQAKLRGLLRSSWD